MNRVCRICLLAAALAALAVSPAAAQMLREFPASSRFELDPSVQLDRVDGAVLAHLERVKAYLADRQWDEAVATLCRVMEGSDDRLLGVTDRRFISLREYCQLQLAALPIEALKLYRGRIDPVAKKWYEDGVAGRDRRSLLRVVDEAFASSWGDDALLALGELALESGDTAAARWYWERILPASPPPDAPPTWLGYPDTDLDPAAVRARLVLASILEGSTARARDELAQFVRLHAEARGRLGGKDGNYAETLRALLAESLAWPVSKPDADWPTFAGSPTRNKTAPVAVDPAGVAWRIPLRGGPGAAVDAPAGAPLSFHPVLAGDMVLVDNQHEIFAVRLPTGEPAWPEADRTIFREQLEGLVAAPDPAGVLGSPQYTATLCDGKLYARMGNAVTARPLEPTGVQRAGYLVCLDLAAEGWLLWKVAPEEGWSFEGSPLVDGENVYVAVRRQEVRPQAHVACFDARTGQQRWRRFVCGAETPAQGMLPESSHSLLTLDRQTLYFNTNLGAVAALSTDDGRLRWLSLYPRARSGDLAKLAPHWRRQLNPCLLDHGTLLVAPADSPRIFALDAATGQILWQTGTEVEDVVDLLGTTGEHLIAGGGKLYWIATGGETRGRVEHVWPEGPEKPGCGRGVLAADSVFWPTREKIYVLDQKTAQPKKTIDLLPRGVTGGNLLVGRGYLLIATGTELIALGPDAGTPKHRVEEVADARKDAEIAD